VRNCSRRGSTGARRELSDQIFTTVFIVVGILSPFVPYYGGVYYGRPEDRKSDYSLLLRLLLLLTLPLILRSLLRALGM
jgi:hypothetical protein